MPSADLSAIDGCSTIQINKLNSIIGPIIFLVDYSRLLPYARTPKLFHTPRQQAAIDILWILKENWYVYVWRSKREKQTQSGNIVFTSDDADVAQLHRHEELTLSLLEKKLKTVGTARNWNTILQLQKMLQR